MNQGGRRRSSVRSTTNAKMSSAKAFAHVSREGPLCGSCTAVRNGPVKGRNGPFADAKRNNVNGIMAARYLFIQSAGNGRSGPGVHP